MMVCALTIQSFVLSLFLLRFNDVKNGCPDEKVGEGGHNEAEGSNVLLLHSTVEAPASASSGLIITSKHIEVKSAKKRKY